MAYGNPQRLYVLQTADGTLKAGITSRSGDERIKQHARTLQIARHHIGSQFVASIDAEGALLKRLALIGTVVRGREWFKGVEFSDAVQILEEVSHEFVNPNPTSKAHLLRTGRAMLRFNDDEIAVIDRLARMVGKSRALLCRELAMDGVIELVGGGHEKNFPSQPTFNHRQVS